MLGRPAIRLRGQRTGGKRIEEVLWLEQGGCRLSKPVTGALPAWIETLIEFPGVLASPILDASVELAADRAIVGAEILQPPGDPASALCPAGQAKEFPRHCVDLGSWRSSLAGEQEWL